MKRSLFIGILVLFLCMAVSCRDETVDNQDDRSTIFRGEVIDLRGQDVAEPSGMVSDGTNLCILVQSSSDVYAPLTLDADGNHKTDSTLAPQRGLYNPYHGGARVSDTFYLDTGERITFETKYTETDADVWAVLRQGSNVLFSVSPAADLGYDLHTDDPTAGETFLIKDAVSLAAENGTAYVLLTSEGLCAYRADGSLIWTQRGETGSDIVVCDTGLLLLSYDEAGQALYRISPADGARSKIPYPDETADFCATGDNDALFTGGGHDLYATTIGGLYALDFTEDGDALTAHVTHIMDWLSSGILPGSVHNICMMDAETAFLVTDDLSGNGGGHTLSRYTMIPKDELIQKEQVVLALFETRNSYQLPVFYFNRTCETHEIVIRDYSMYDEDERVLTLNADIAAGDIPDIVIMPQYSTIDTALSVYERSGLFCDLTPLMQSDADFRYDDLLSYVTTPYLLNGTQYLFPLTPSFTCYVGDAAVFSGPVTVDEYLDLCEETGGLPLAGKRLFSAAVDDHYDEPTATATFDDGTLEKQMTRSESMQDNTGSSLLSGLYLPYTTVFSFVEQTNVYGGYDRFTAVGYPNAERELCMGAVLSDFYAVTETCSAKDIAVDFLQSLMEDMTPIPLSEMSREYQYVTIPFGYTYYRSDLLAQAEEFKGYTVVVQGSLYRLFEDDDPALANADGTHLKVTEGDAQALIELLDSVTRRVNDGAPVNRLFWETYFEMTDRPRSDMLDIAQSKISIYLAEQQD